MLLAGSIILASSFAQAAQTEEFTLKNGMKIIVNEDHRAPTVAHMIWYRVGAVDERNGTTGVAHALEHMMFKGTKKLKVGEFSQRVAQLGGRENAFTSKDYTAYFQQIEKSKLEAVMALEADRMVNLQFDKNEFAKEIRVVMEERRLRTDDQPIAMVQEALTATAYAAHPYRNPVIGWMDDLQNMTVADVKAWHDAWYVPNNATMVVSGDVDAKQVFALAEKYFGRNVGRAFTRTRPQNEPPQLGIKRVTVKAPAENPYVVLAFKVPALHDVKKDDDAFALDVLAAVLDGYDNARLTAKLVRTDRVANEVGASYSGVARGPVMFLLDGSPAAGNTTEQLEKQLRAEVTRIATDGVSEAELKRVKTQLIAGQVYKRDSVFGQAMEIGAMEMSGLSYKDIDLIIERLRAVTPQQVQSVAQKYFGDDALTVATLVPLPMTDKRPAGSADSAANGPLH
ncbi:M16 family metallopeptidase [Herminiimonas fonticola]|uniref:Zinc protease n=1 Tax=Herminiimonas fonticola TaxID=303380 RepID=A0A4R6GGX3_9BURK|nr:pitrilysin family protein [Herminiimonas fonticola]RBA25028.1 putative Zn-dependent peptidase [Herminiimonas fonticola]TDN94143.1 zinc protease [Herminiimonas fonticola]